jgi:hypothetical protein
LLTLQDWILPARFIGATMQSSTLRHSAATAAFAIAATRTLRALPDHGDARPAIAEILDCVFDIYFSPLMSATSTLPVADSVM